MSNIQFSLFDNRGNQSSNSSEIAWIDTEKLLPHPDNPRLIYREDIIEAIATSINENGFQPCYALLVRPHNGAYQVISGHTRLKASQKVGLPKLPCWIKDMDDEAAFMELVLANNQGELSPLEYGMHVLKYVELSEGGRGKKGGLSEYARVVGKGKSTISECFSGAKTFKGVNCSDVRTVLGKTSCLAAIHKTPQDDWQWLTELLISEGWSVKQTEQICLQVREIAEMPCPAWLAEILPISSYRRKAISDNRIASILKSCISASETAMGTLPTEVLVEKVMGEELIEETWLPQKMYVDRLKNTQGIGQNLTPGKFTKPAEKIKKEIADLSEKADQWKRERAQGEELERLQSEEKERLRQWVQIYSPQGIYGDVRDVLPRMMADHLNKFDLVLTDPPYLLSNDGITARGNKQVSVNKNFDDSKDAIAPESWLSDCLRLLKPGGVLVFTSTEHLNISVSRLESQGFEFLERLFWVKKSAPPRLTPTGHRSCVEEIWVCRKPGEPHFFDYEFLKEKYGNGSQVSNVLNFEQCSGSERLGWHDTQKPISLWRYLMEAYSPEEGRVLDPFGGSGTTAVVAKSIRRICTWVEKNGDFFSQASKRIESSPFFWEEA